MRELRERALGTLSDAALPKGTVIRCKTKRGILRERERDRAGVPFYTAKYHHASEIVMQIGKRNKLKQKTENLNLNFLSMEFNVPQKRFISHLICF